MAAMGESPLRAGLKSVLRRLLPRRAYNALAEAWVLRTDGYARRSYSQEAEDLVIEDLMGPVSQGFYVDIGAYHPVRFSNTYRFYRAGWRGVNIDALPGSMAKFRRLRPRDINIEVAISRDAGDVPLYVFAEHALNTLDPALAGERARTHNLAYTQTTIRARPLREVLAEFLPAGQTIDFLSLDVEAHELEVLESNDWTRFRPRWLLVESLRTDPGAPADDPVHRYLTGLGYRPVARTRLTAFYAGPDTALRPLLATPGPVMRAS